MFDIHAYAQQKAAEHKIAVDTVVLSNRVSIGAKAIQAFSDQGIQISISLDGIGEAHDAQRKFVNGMGSFAWVDRTIQKLIAEGVSPQKILFISIETPIYNTISIDALFTMAQKATGKMDATGWYVFIDEIQYLIDLKVM